MNPAQRELLTCLSKILVLVLPILFRHLEIAILWPENRWRHRMWKVDDLIKMGRHQRNHPEKRFWTNGIPTLTQPFERKLVKWKWDFRLFETEIDSFLLRKYEFFN